MVVAHMLKLALSHSLIVYFMGIPRNQALLED